jgi:hypothetical protein
MLVELGNHQRAFPTIDERPSVTRVNIPDYDDGSTHDDAVYATAEGNRTLAELERSIPDGATLVEPGPPKGGHSHQPGELTAAQFKEHITDARLFNQGITRLPGHEAALSVEAAWSKMGHGRPAWVSVNPGLRPDDHGADLEQVLSEFYDVPTLADYFKVDNPHDAHTLKETKYWTPNGQPGENRGLILPPLEALYTVDGRIMNNLNDGGDALQSIMMGTGSAAGATTLTTGQTLVTNATAGHRVYVYTTAGTAFVWGNCISNTNAASASVITVDQWYVPLTPGGSAGSNPGTPWSWVLVDGGMISTWFAAIGTGGTPTVTNTDHTLATGGQTEYPTAAGGLYRKICPTAVDVSASTRTVTLVPVWTVNGSDTGLPRVIDIVGFFASMVPGFGGAGGPMKFEDAVSPTATLAAISDQLTLTEVITGS